jgi:hypothetical protein
MTSPNSKLEKRLRISGVFVILGLVVELISLKWSHPTAFLLFVIVGGMFMAAGMVLYLFSLVTAEREKDVLNKENTV